MLQGEAQGRVRVALQLHLLAELGAVLALEEPGRRLPALLGGLDAAQVTTFAQGGGVFNPPAEFLVVGLGPAEGGEGDTCDQQGLGLGHAQPQRLDNLGLDLSRNGRFGTRFVHRSPLFGRAPPGAVQPGRSSLRPARQPR